MRLYLHSELSSAHASHGADHEDYAQYAAYCTRRLSRLRHGQAVRKELLRCRMYKNALSTRAVADGDGGGGGSSKARHAYRPIELSNLPADALASHGNYFWEPLFCAERAWAQSMEAKAEGAAAGTTADGRDGGGALGGGGTDPRSGWSSGRFRARSIKRLRKAAKFAATLEALTASTKAAPSAAAGDDDGGAEEDPVVADDANPPVDEHTRLEAKAYASWMRGNLALEQNRWQTACNEYQTALALCESLAGDGGGGDKGDMQQLELFDFFTTRAQNVIAPLLRYCHYELQVRVSCREVSPRILPKCSQPSSGKSLSTLQGFTTSLLVKS